MPQTIKVADVQAADERQYIAISYRWPQNLPEDHQLTLTTRDEFYAGYITHKLPSVYRDAMKVTAMLGFRYMWLDALVRLAYLVLDVEYNEFTDSRPISASCRDPAVTGI
jgi:heterokaryon incompatibility protein (HET)